MLLGLFDDSRNDNQIDFEKFYEEYFSYVFALISAKIDNIKDSEDMTADIFFELLEKKEKLSKIKYIKSYLNTIVQNKCADYYKKKKTNDTVSLSEDTVAYEDSYDLGGETNAVTDERETAKQVISMLSEKDKELYEEIRVHKKFLKQVSEEKQVDYVTLRKRYSRLEEKVIKIIHELL